MKLASFLSLTVFPAFLTLGLACGELDDKVKDDDGTSDSGATTTDGGTVDGGGESSGDGGGKSDGGGEEKVDCLTLTNEACRLQKHCMVQWGYPIERRDDLYCYDDSGDKVDLGCTHNDCGAATVVVTSTGAPEACQWWLHSVCVPSGYVECGGVDPNINQCP